MTTSNEYHIFTRKQQKFCIECYESKTKNFKMQSTYKNYRVFLNNLNVLVALNIMSKEWFFHELVYGLTADGKLFVEEVLRK